MIQGHPTWSMSNPASGGQRHVMQHGCDDNPSASAPPESLFILPLLFYASFLLASSKSTAGLKMKLDAHNEKRLARETRFE